MYSTDVYEVENMIAGVIGYDSIRKHLAECGYHTVEIREKYYLWRADVYMDLRKKNDEEYLRDEEE